jgi:thiamine monophosphate synthase
MPDSINLTGTALGNAALGIHVGCNGESLRLVAEVLVRHFAVGASVTRTVG